MSDTYDIERRDLDAHEQPRWHGDLGESTEWPSVEAAAAAIESLRDLGDDWLGDYRIVEHESRRVVRQVQLGTDVERALAEAGRA